MPLCALSAFVLSGTVLRYGDVSTKMAQGMKQLKCDKGCVDVFVLVITIRSRDTANYNY